MSPARASIRTTFFVASLAVALEQLAVFLVLASSIFLALRLLPGDPATLILGDRSGEIERAALRAKLHFDEPLPVQYMHFLRNVARLDLGESLRRPGIRVAQRVVESLGSTAILAFFSVGLASVLGVGSAVLSNGSWLGKRKVWVERGRVLISAIPLLVLAPVLTYLLACRLRVLPLPGDPDAGVSGLLFAGGLLAVPLAAQIGRVTHVALLSQARLPFLLAVRARGGSELRMWALHALAPVFGPVVTVISTQLGALLGGALVLEKLFDRRGLGMLIVESYASRDFPVLEASLVGAGALFIATQAIGRAVHVLVDPRARAS